MEHSSFFLVEVLVPRLPSSRGSSSVVTPASNGSTLDRHDPNGQPAGNNKWCSPTDVPTSPVVIKCGLPETFFISENEGHKNQGKAHPKAPL